MLTLIERARLALTRCKARQVIAEGALRGALNHKDIVGLDTLHLLVVDLDETLLDRKRLETRLTKLEEYEEGEY